MGEKSSSTRNTVEDVTTESLEKPLEQVKANIKEFSGQLASIHGQRKKILKEVIRILQEMPQENPASAKAKSWLSEYANYTDSLKDLAKELSAQSEAIVHTHPLIGDANQLLDETAKLNSALFALAESDNAGEEDSQDQNSNARHQKQENSKQQRNKTAVIIKRRINEKLEGRDPDANVKKSVKDQVTHVVSEARAVHNLALMYEGWTSWV